MEPAKILRGAAKSCLLVVVAILLTAPSGFSQSPSPSPTPVPTPIIEPVAPTQIIADSEKTLRTLRTMDRDLEAPDEIPTVKENLDTFVVKVAPFYADSARMLESNPSLDRLRTLDEEWHLVLNYLSGWRTLLSKRSKELEENLIGLNPMIETWKNIPKDPVTSTPEISQRIQAVLSLAESVKVKTIRRQKELTRVEGKLSDQESRVQDMLEAIRKGNSQAVTNLFVRDVAPAWSEQVRGSMGQSLTRSPESWTSQSAAVQTYLAWQKNNVLIQGLMAVTFIGGLIMARKKMRRWAGESAELKTAVQVFETPVAAGLLLALINSSWLYPFAPDFLKGCLGAMMLIPTALILHRLVQPRLFPVLYALVFFYFLDQVRLLSGSQPGFLRIIFLSESLLAVLFLVWLLLNFRKEETEKDVISRTVQIGGRLALIVITFAFFADLAGYARLGTVLLNGALRSSYVAVVLYAVALVAQGLFLLSLHLPVFAQFNLVRKHRPLLVHRAFKFLYWVAFIAWVTFTLEMFSLRAPFYEAIKAFLLAKHSIGSLDFSILPLVGFGLTIWAAFLLSRLVRFVLEHDVYPRFELEQGLPYAISSTLHYVILLLTFFAATAAVGIDMTKFTILVSAFGVGIGFGLQNIINNFVSGLILLFERPIKIGDAIQVGDAVGTVRRIGIRASIVRTNSGSEIIVPNATMISTNVTNWTLSKKRRIIVLPITVVRGPDPDHIIDVIKKVTATNPSILKEPVPKVIVTNLTANLSYELRVWTDEVVNWFYIRSDLLLSINAALEKEDIKIG